MASTTDRFPWIHYQEIGNTFFTKVPAELRMMIYKAYFELHNPRIELQSQEGERTSLHSSETPQKPPTIYTKGASAVTSLMKVCRRVHNEARPLFAQYFTCIMTSSQIMRELEQKDFFGNIKTLEIADKHVFQDLTWWDGTSDGGYYITHCLQAVQQLDGLESITLDFNAVGFFTDSYADGVMPSMCLHEKANQVLNVTLKCTGVGVWHIVEAPKFRIVCKELVAAWSLYRQQPVYVPKGQQDEVSHFDGAIVCADSYGCKSPDVSLRLAKAHGDIVMIVHNLWSGEDDDMVHNADIQGSPDQLMSTFLTALVMNTYWERVDYDQVQRDTVHFPVPVPLELWNSDPHPSIDPYRLAILLAPLDEEVSFDRVSIPVP